MFKKGEKNNLNEYQAKLMKQMRQIDKELSRLEQDKKKLESKGCYSDKELYVKQYELEELNTKLESLKLNRDKLWGEMIGVLSVLNGTSLPVKTPHLRHSP